MQSHVDYIAHTMVMHMCSLYCHTFNYHCVNGLTDKFLSEDYTSQVLGSLSSPWPSLMRANTKYSFFPEWLPA